MDNERRIQVETTIREQIRQRFCTWPGGPGCENASPSSDICCGAYGWRTIKETCSHNRAGDHTVTVLKLQGVLVLTTSNPDTVEIDGTDVIDAITSIFGWQDVKVTMALGDETFTGDLHADEGSAGYSEWTPGDPSKLWCGQQNVLSRLIDFDGKTVTFWVADEPINTLDDRSDKIN